MVSAAARSTSPPRWCSPPASLLIARRAPAWCVAIALAAAMWRVLVALGRVAPAEAAAPGMRFAAGAITAVAGDRGGSDFRTLNGLAAGTALLLVMGALKLLEIARPPRRWHRDRRRTVPAAGRLRSPRSRCRAFHSIYCTRAGAPARPSRSSPIAAARCRPRGAAAVGARAGMALPLAAACFLFFPRDRRASSGRCNAAMQHTGLSDEMTPGSIGRLAIEYDPRSVSASKARRRHRAALLARSGAQRSSMASPGAESRHILPRRARRAAGRADPLPRHARAHRPAWLFALDTVDASPRRDVVHGVHDRQLSVPEPITEPRSYDAVSYLRTRSYGAAVDLRHDATRPRCRRSQSARLALALDIRARAGSDAEFARAVLAWFRDNGLEYTLEPGATARLGGHHVVRQQAGLLRPLRLRVRHADARRGRSGTHGHRLSRRRMESRRRLSARAAVGCACMDGDLAGWPGWTRIDPTAVVAPERLQRGIFE